MPTRESSHDPRLQAMRGIAAMLVTLGHCLVTFRNYRFEEPDFRLAWDNAILAFCQVLIQANTAVIFFFVLSGFVLSESLRRATTTPIRDRLMGFVVRRVLRLYPAMMPSVLLAAVILLAISTITIPGMTATMAAAMSRQYGLYDLAANLTGLQIEINPVLWSVQVEIVMIALLPILLAVSNRVPLIVDSAFLVALIFIGIHYWDALPNPLRFVYCFQLGLMLPRLITSPALRPIFESGALTMAALLILLPTDWLYIRGTLWLPYKFAINAFVSAQVIGFVLVRAESRASRHLAAPTLVFLGDVSYSFYVYAMTVQLALTAFLLPHLMSGTPSNAAATWLTLLLMAATVSIALPLAAASYHLIEKPSIAIGRSLSASFRGRLEILATAGEQRGYRPRKIVRIGPARCLYHPIAYHPCSQAALHQTNELQRHGVEDALVHQDECLLERLPQQGHRVMEGGVAVVIDQDRPASAKVEMIEARATYFIVAIEQERGVRDRDVITPRSSRTETNVAPEVEKGVVEDCDAVRLGPIGVDRDALDG